MTADANRRSAMWKYLPALAAFLVVLAVQLSLVHRAGTDVPFYDQWDAEGRQTYPGVLEGTWSFRHAFAPHNEHRILWTRLANVALFKANGNRWDPLVQQSFNALLHAIAAGLLVGFIARGHEPRARWLVAASVALLSAPLAAWHNALWGFQSHVYFVLIFSTIALGCLGSDKNAAERGFGWLGVAAALLAMGAGAFVVPALLVSWILGRRASSIATADWVYAALAVLAAIALRERVPEHEIMRATSVSEWLGAFCRLAGWPHTGQPLAVVVVNLPLLAAVYLRGKPAGERDALLEFPVALGFFSLLTSAAAAWARGGGDEFAVGLPSRYVDFAALLPMANAGALVALLIRNGANRLAPVAAAAWSLFILVGLVGESSVALRRVILPRAADRDAPVRLMQQYQRSRDPRVFQGQPRLLVPHPNPGSIDAVLDDPRLRGALPPSLQPQEPQGPLSRSVRIW